MRKLFIAATLAALTALPATASAQSERTVTGAAIGAGAGAVVAGPVGAVVGGTAGAVIGGPRITHRHRSCWHDSRGYRHCHLR
jgi:osmotically inducible lipoprotein OsmB